jgi:hypothetical protein
MDLFMVPHTDCDGIFLTNIPENEQKNILYLRIICILCSGMSTILPQKLLENAIPAVNAQRTSQNAPGTRFEVNYIMNLIPGALQQGHTYISCTGDDKLHLVPPYSNSSTNYCSHLDKHSSHHVYEVMHP